MERKTLDEFQYEQGKQEYKEDIEKTKERSAGVVITKKDYPCTGCQEIIPSGSKARSRSFNVNNKWETRHAHWPNCSNPEINTQPKELKEEQQELFEK